MRDTSVWSGSPYTSKPYLAATVRRRYPNFQWYGEGSEPGSTAFYALPNLGETWGDSPGTIKETRERDLPTRYRYGGFVVMGDSVSLTNGNILRVTSLRAGSQGADLWWKEIDAVDDLASYETLTLATAPRAWTGIGLARHSTPNVARLFYIRSSDSKLCFKDYSGGAWGTAYQYTGSPAFNYDGAAVAPVGHDEGFVITYDPASYKVTLHHFYAGAWSSRAMPMRFPQHFLNCHWFDAVYTGSGFLVTFCVNGVQYATLHDSSGFHDPWPVIAFDPEFGGAQTRICKLATVGSRIFATAWSRFAGSSDDYEVSYYHLLWTDDGVNWALPEEGYIGQTAARGKLHVKDAAAYIVGASVSYVGDAVAWLGGSAGVQTTIANNMTGHDLVQELDRASELKLPLLVADSFDRSLLEYGNEIVFKEGLLGEGTVDLATLTLDTPGTTLDSRSNNMEMVCRGPLKKLISYTVPMDQSIEGPVASHFDFKEGGLYARWGDWSHEVSGVGTCARHDDNSDALATVGVQYSGQFQISTRLRITGYLGPNTGGIVFWYEGPQDYYRLDLTGNLGGHAVLRQIKAGQGTALANVAITGGMAANTWYDVVLRYTAGVLSVYVRPAGGSWEQVIAFSDWTDPEPVRWYAGLFCSLAKTKLTAELKVETTHKALAQNTAAFPASGNILVDDEIITYSAKTATQFGSGNAHSLIRGVRSTRVGHPTDSLVYVADSRFEADYFSVYQDDRPMSVADACTYLSTMTGVPMTLFTHVDDTEPNVRVFPQLHGHSWVLSGQYANQFTLYFWTDTANPPQSGIKLVVTTTTATLSDIVGGTIMAQPVSVANAGTFQVQVQKDTIFVWANGRFACGFNVPGDKSFRVGSVACGGDTVHLMADELFEPIDAIMWSMRESARDVMQRLLEGRDATLRELSDGSVQVTLLERRGNLGTLTGQYFVTYQQAAADQEWASAMIAWGAEDWVMVTEPKANRLRWVEWHTPHIYDRMTLRHRAMRRLRKLWALHDLRTFRGPFDPRMEVGDELTIDSIRGIPAGRYMVHAIEVIGEPALLDMQVTVQALPDDLTVATWPIRLGVDRPSEG